MSEKLKAFYFNHDENASGDIKLMALRSQLAMEGYGIYWFLIEQLSLAGGRMQMRMIPMLAATMQTTADKAMSVIRNYELFVVDEDGFFSERLNRQLEKRGTLSEAGRKAGLKSAEMRKLKALPSTTVERPLNDSATKPQPEEKRREEKRIEEDKRENSPAFAVDEGDTKSAFDLRRDEFKKQINAAGGLIYTKPMLDEFFLYWSEANRSKRAKMRFELQKTWEIDRRLVTWTKRPHSYECFLTEEQIEVKTKKQAFATQLESFFEVHPRPLLLEFYHYWTQTENKPGSKRLRWETEDFWDLPTRLGQWASRKSQGIPQRHETAAR